MSKASKDWWRWLRKGCLKRATEALIMAAQEQAIRTNITQKQKFKRPKKTVNVECVEKLKRV